jgi:protocatechuate 3,4-dioxygenase beta subunit
LQALFSKIFLLAARIGYSPTVFGREKIAWDSRIARRLSPTHVIMRCRQSFRRVQTIAATLIAAALMQTICAARLSADDPPEEPATLTTRANPRPASGAKGAASRAGQQLNRFDHQPDTLDELKSAMDGYTDYKTFTCTGQVRDALFNKPIEGAEVIILKLASPQRYRPGDAKVLKRIEATTDADGKYTFTLPTDHAFIPPPPATNAGQRFSEASQPGGAREVPYIPLETQVSHPAYAATRTSSKVYLHSSTNSRNYVPEGFSQPQPEPDPAARIIGLIELRPGKEVTAIVQSADGKPLAGVKVIAHSQVPKNERMVADGVSYVRRNSGLSADEAKLMVPSHDETQTDANGRFRVVMITPGEGMLAIFPADGKAAPRFEYVYDKRGDLGVITMARGETIRGRVLSSDGKPLDGVFVSAMPLNGPGIKYSDASVSQQLIRTVETDAEGNFTIDALPPGDYRLAPDANYNDPTVDPHDWPDPRPVPGLFIQQTLTIGDAPQPPVEIRALATVALEGRFIIPEPAANVPIPPNGGFNRQRLSTMYLNRVSIQGKWNDLVYRQVVQTDEDWNFKATVPKGLREAAVSLPATISPSGNAADSRAARWRIGKDGDFRDESQIDLGTLDADVRDIEIDFSRSAGAGGRGGFNAAPAGAAPAAAAGGFGGPAVGRGGAANRIPANRVIPPVAPPATLPQQPVENPGGADGN